MAPGEKINVALEADLVARTREQLGDPVAGLDDAGVIERAVNAYLLRRLVQQAQAGSDLTAEEAERVAYEELHAMRRERRPAA